MSRLRRRIQSVVHRAGIHLARYPQSDPLWRVVQVLAANDVGLVLDVGANDGGYATGIRHHGYRGRIASFEPLRDPFRGLQERARSVPGWDAFPYAIGAERGEITMNVAGNRGASSSVLPMLERHVAAEPTSAYVGVETSEMHRLDDLLPTLVTGEQERVFLKIDVQGYEHAVLDGAMALLASDLVVGLQMELSFTPLYEGAMSWKEGFDRADDLGLDLVDLLPGFTDPSGRLLQADGVFLRR